MSTIRGNMSASMQPSTLSEMVRLQAMNHGDALAFEFEGRITTLAEFDRKTNVLLPCLKSA
jgi:3-oxoacyl-[acyl-carrier-protein] synthase III